METHQELAEVVNAYGLAVLPFSPLAGGSLSGKYQTDTPLPDSARAGRIQERCFDERKFRLLAEMEAIGRQNRLGPAQVALAWLLAKPQVAAPIAGANNLERLQAMLSAIGFRLDRDEVAALDKLSDWRPK